MKKAVSSLLFASTVLIPAVSFAGADSGFYVGGAIGQANAKAGEGSFTVDDSSTAYKVIAGYNLGLLPLIDLAVEADYRDFGDFSDNSGASKTGVTAINVYGLAGFNMGPIGLFGKVGFSNADSDTIIANEKVNSSDSSATYGIGAKVQLGSVAVRAEYESFDLEDTDKFYMFSVGGTITF